MYIPRRYEEKDREEIFQFIRENSFGILISVTDGVPMGTHIPLLLETDAEGNSVLSGHISKGNGQKQALTEGAKVLVIFPGPHAYISPRWYTQLTVPTWNYVSVHAYGTVKLLEGAALWEHLRKLMHNYEQSMPHPVAMEEVPEKTLEDNFRGIIGFEIHIDDLQAAYKLSQNRDAESHHNIIVQLEKGDDTARAVAEEMKKKTNFDA